MSADTIVQAHIDSAIKKEASVVLDAIGLTESDAVRIFFTKIAKDKEFPFEPLIPNTTTIAAMAEVERGDLPSFDSVDALMDSLNSEDNV